ncbi:hypothetical protein AALO_G00013880 [Alosa alosa]|uniref:Centrosomin N-terminal motif 1 domain-containing protein n=1 Tax=Alosa alosa TaxID=278164 RepID=A0AAV6HJC4_9TELE|nr:hypothetical protein AALO_G00013880 [Alosa alosa]
MDAVNSRGTAQGYPLSMDWADSEEQTWKETERAEPLDKEGNASRSAGHMTDFSKDELDNAPPLQPHTLREFEQHLNDLKKENFSLKLRIYFLEERIQQKFEDSSDDVYRTNIELKVEVESLKQELQEKQQLLDKAITTAESLTNHNEAEVQRRCDERQQEINHMQEVLETRIQLLQEEALLARSEAERMATLADTRSQNSCVTMETGTSETPEEESLQLVNMLPDGDKDQVIEELRQALCSKERVIGELTEEKKLLGERVEQLEEQVEDLNSSLLQKERDAEFYQEELGRERLRIQQEMQVRV